MVEACRASATQCETASTARVKELYAELGNPGNIDVIDDGSWLTRGHSSHIFVGCIIEMYTGIVIDHIVMPHCTSGPKENKDTLTGSSSMLHCARKTQIVRLTRWKWPRA